MLSIKYGTIDKNIDVTEIANTLMKRENYIKIPNTEASRERYFTDPLEGTLKSIFITKNDITTKYDETMVIFINCTNFDVESYTYENIPMHFKLIFKDLINYNSIKTRLNEIHSTLTLAFGNFYEEYPEQLMVCRYLNGNENVLEIGGNIGRNSCIISSIVGDNLVTLESDLTIANQLRENRDSNHLSFHIENSALSNRKLIQHSWNTIPSDTLLEGYNCVNTITYSELLMKYDIDFDTLVLDCEGAFYYILMDMPEILNNIQLIIMENDYTDLSHKIFIDDILTKNNFAKHYVESGGWGACENFFFEVWKK